MSPLEALHAAIGTEVSTGTDVVERRHLTDFLLAVDEADPGPADEVPATFVACFLVEPPALPEAEAYGDGWLNGGDAFELLAPVRVGDTLTSTQVLTDVVEKQGSAGAMALLTLVTEFVLPDGTVAARHTGTRIRT